MSNVLSQFESEELRRGYRQLIAQFGTYVELSRDVACTSSESYREFEVGTVGIAMRPGIRELVTVEGANLKINHLPSEKEFEDDREAEIDKMHEEFGIPRNLEPVCAEMDAIIESEGKDFFFIAHIITATTDKQEIIDVTHGIATATLPCCANCVPVLDKSPATSKATLYVSAGLDRDVFQVRNMRMLKDLYRKREEAGVTLGRISLENTQLSLHEFDRKIENHSFGRTLPARVISSFARHALTYPSTLPT